MLGGATANLHFPDFIFLHTTRGPARLLRMISEPDPDRGREEAASRLPKPLEASSCQAAETRGDSGTLCGARGAAEHWSSTDPHDTDCYTELQSAGTDLHTTSHSGVRNQTFKKGSKETVSFLWDSYFYYFYIFSVSWISMFIL